MDYGDIIRLIVFGFIFLSFFSGLFGGKKKDEKASKPQQLKPVRPTELSQSGGPERPQPKPQPPPRPMVFPEPAGPVEVYTGEGMSRTEARREELRERFGGELEVGRRDPLERGIRDTEGVMLERDITDMPPIEDLDPERRPRRRRQVPRSQRQRIRGADLLREWLQDPTTLERAFIVKEVLDRPIALRDDR